MRQADIEAGNVLTNGKNGFRLVERLDVGGPQGAVVHYANYFRDVHGALRPRVMWSGRHRSHMMLTGLARWAKKGHAPKDVADSVRWMEQT